MFSMQKRSFHTAKKYLWLFYALNIALLVFAAIQLAGAGAGERTTPEILGARDLTYCVGQTPAYFRGVRVNTDGDAGVVLKVDSTRVDMTTPGVYPLFYTARDAEGNVAHLEVSVTVLSSPENRA